MSLTSRIRVSQRLVSSPLMEGGFLAVSPSLSSSFCLNLRLCCTSRLDFRQSSQQHCKRPSRGHLSSALRYSQHLSQFRKTSPSHLLHVLPSGVQHPGGGQTGECPLVFDRCCSGELSARVQTGFNLIVIFFLVVVAKQQSNAIDRKIDRIY